MKKTSPLYAKFCGVIASLCLAAAASVPAAAQSATPTRVYTTTSATTDTTGAGPSILNGFTQDATTGALSAVAGSPFNERLGGSAIAVDALGRFLFVANQVESDISMFQINPVTGALTEVAGSPFEAAAVPFSAGTLGLPVVLATEPTGQFLYVGYNQGSLGNPRQNPTTAVVAYAIDANHGVLTALPQELDQQGEYLFAMLTDALGKNLYVANGTDNSPGFQIFQINSSTGMLTAAPAATGNPFGRSAAIDPKGRFIYFGTGQFHGFIQGWTLSLVDGLVTGGIPSLSDFPIGSFPTAMAVDSTGAYLYAEINTQINIYAIDQISGSLTLRGSPVPIAASSRLIADTQAPFLYATSVGTQVHAYRITPATGALAEIAGSPFGTAAGVARNIAIAPARGATSPISGPLPQFETSSVVFADTSVTTTSATFVERLVNNGQQNLIISSISISGLNSTDFTQANSCGPVLIPGAFCSVSLNFKPSATGTRQAALVVTDNGPGGTQSAALTGSGRVALPALTLVPSTLTFSTILAGTTSAAQSVSVMNSGAAALTVSSVALTGANPGDFTFGNGCAAAVPVTASCTIAVTFSPLAGGQRTAQLLLTDNAPGSPHTVSLTGGATNPFVLSTSGSASPAATITAGSTAQFSMQLSTALGVSGSVQLQCSGVPQSATCSIPASVAISGGTITPFTVAVATAAAGVSPGSPDSPGSPAAARPWQITPLELPFTALASLLAIGAMLCLLGKRNTSVAGRAAKAARLAHGMAALALILMVTLAGCGGGSGGSSSGSNTAATTTGTGVSTSTSTTTSSTTTTPPPTTTTSGTTGTPRGTYTVIVTATATSGVQQQFPLTLTVQ